MNFAALDAEWQFPKGLIGIQADCIGAMESRVRRTTLASAPDLEYKRPHQPQGNDRKSFPSSYFSIESFLVLICLTASMILLPLILPPLPPPPFLLLLLPVGLLVMLMFLAFMPSDMRNIASSYL